MSTLFISLATLVAFIDDGIFMPVDTARMASLALPPVHVMPFKSDAGDACAARLGIIILSVDETIEFEFSRYFSTRQGVVMYHSRQFKGPSIDVHSLNSTKANISASAQLLPSFPFDAIGFACTSDAAVLGPSAIAGLVAAGASVSHSTVTNPMTAAIRAFHALGAQRIAVLTPYTEDITRLLVSVFDQSNITVTSIATFNQATLPYASRLAKPSQAQPSPAKPSQA